MRTSLSRPFLILCGVLYLGFGLAVLLAPGAGVRPPDPFADTGFLGDVTGTHGGLNITAGLFLLYAAVSGPWHRAGVLLVALMNAGYLGGRLVAAASGDISGPSLAAMALETTLLAVAVHVATNSTPGASPGGRTGPAAGTPPPGSLV